MERAVKDLKPHSLNEKLYGDEDLPQDFLDSVKEKGILVPLVVKENGTIISGHRRWRAAKAANVETVPERGRVILKDHEYETPDIMTKERKDGYHRLLRDIFEPRDDSNIFSGKYGDDYMYREIELCLRDAFTLHKKKHRILMLYYGLATGEPLSGGKIADRFGISASRVYQYRLEALRILRTGSHMDALYCLIKEGGATDIFSKALQKKRDVIEKEKIRQLELEELLRLGISNRTPRVLKANGINSLKDLVAVPIDDLMQMRGFGRTSRREVVCFNHAVGNKGDIMKDYDKDRQLTICVDLDGTILEYDGWKCPYHFGELLPGAKESLEKLRERGWRIIIFTTRGSRDMVSMVLRKHGIPFDYINHNPDQPPGSNPGKPIADVYLDDRAIRFFDWRTAMREIDHVVDMLCEEKQGRKKVRPEDILSRDPLARGDLEG